MNFKTTAVLILLALAGALALWFARPSANTTPAAREEKPAEPRYLFDPRPLDADVVRIDVQRRDKPRMVFERGPRADDPNRLEDWRMVEPSPSAAEIGMVGNISGIITQMQTRLTYEENPSPETLNACGFSPSRGTVILTMKDGREYAVEFGKVAPATTDTYVRILGKPAIYLVRGDMVKQHLNQDVKQFRSKTLLRATSSEITQFAIEYEGKRYELTRNADKNWIIQSPVKAHGDNEKINSFLTRFASLRLVDFSDDAPDTPLSSYGLDQPYLAVSVTTETRKLKPATQPVDGESAEPEYETATKTTTVQFGSFADLKTDNRFAKLGDQSWIGVIAKSTVEGLLPKLNEWRDTRVTRTSAADAMRIDLTVEGASAVLEKIDGKWRGSGDLDEIEPDAVSDILHAFEDLRFSESIDQPEEPVKYGLEAPRAVIRVSTPTSIEPVTLRIGKPTESGRNTFAAVDGQSSVYYIATPQAERLSVAPISLRARTIVSANVQKLRSLDVTRGSTRYALELDGTWKMIDPAGVLVDASGIRELTNDLVRLRAKKVVGKRDDPRFAMDPPDVTIRFTLAQDEAEPTTQAATAASDHVIQVRKTDRVYCVRDDVPFVYELDETVYRVMMSELMNRQLFDFSGDAVTEFRVDAPAGALHLTRQEKTWKYEADPGVKLSQKLVNDFMNDIARMRVESYLAYRDGDLAAEGLESPPAKVQLKLANGREVTIAMQQRAAGELPRKAAIVEERRIFILRHADAENLLRSVDAYVELEPSARQQSPDSIPSLPDPFPPDEDH